MHMPRAEARDHARPILTGAQREVGLAVISYGEAAGRHTAECSCGWAAYHRRLKVVEDKIDAHLSKKHDGRGIRL